MGKVQEEGWSDSAKARHEATGGEIAGSIALQAAESISLFGAISAAEGGGWLQDFKLMNEKKEAAENNCTDSQGVELCTEWASIKCNQSTHFLKLRTPFGARNYKAGGKLHNTATILDIVPVLNVPLTVWNKCYSLLNPITLNLTLSNFAATKVWKTIPGPCIFVPFGKWSGAAFPEMPGSFVLNVIPPGIRSFLNGALFSTWEFSALKKDCTLTCVFGGEFSIVECGQNAKEVPYNAITGLVGPDIFSCLHNIIGVLSNNVGLAASIVLMVCDAAVTTVESGPMAGLESLAVQGAGLLLGAGAMKGLAKNKGFQKLASKVMTRIEANASKDFTKHITTLNKWSGLYIDSGFKWLGGKADLGTTAAGNALKKLIPSKKSGGEGGAPANKPKAGGGEAETNKSAEGGGAAIPEPKAVNGTGRPGMINTLKRLGPTAVKKVGGAIVTIGEYSGNSVGGVVARMSKDGRKGKYDKLKETADNSRAEAKRKRKERRRKQKEVLEDYDKRLTERYEYQKGMEAEKTRLENEKNTKKQDYENTKQTKGTEEQIRKDMSNLEKEKQEYHNASFYKGLDESSKKYHEDELKKNPNSNYHKKSYDEYQHRIEDNDAKMDGLLKKYGVEKENDKGGKKTNQELENELNEKINEKIGERQKDLDEVDSARKEAEKAADDLKRHEDDMNSSWGDYNKSKQDVTELSNKRDELSRQLDAEVENPYPLDKDKKPQKDYPDKPTKEGAPTAADKKRRDEISRSDGSYYHEETHQKEREAQQLKEEADELDRKANGCDQKISELPDNERKSDDDFIKDSGYDISKVDYKENRLSFFGVGYAASADPEPIFEQHQNAVLAQDNSPSNPDNDTTGTAGANDDENNKDNPALQGSAGDIIKNNTDAVKQGPAAKAGDSTPSNAAGEKSAGAAPEAKSDETKKDNIKKEEQKEQKDKKQEIKQEQQEENNAKREQQNPKKETTQQDPKKETSKQEPKKKTTKEEPKKETTKQEPKKETTKQEPKKETTKQEPKKETTKQEPKKETTKQEPKKEQPKTDEEKLNASLEKYNMNFGIG